MTTATTLNAEEVEKFSRIAAEWWSPDGAFKPLHRFNPIRIAYIREKICSHFALDAAQTKPFTGLSLLDIGCGGGLLCEPMTRLGASVTGIDASEKNIAVASLHANESGLEITYQATTAESLAETEQRFDIVLSMEVVEHVDDLPLFIKSATALLKPNGILFCATLNRTAKSFAFAIVGAEYVLRWLPIGTHDWKKFVKPSELGKLIIQNNRRVQALDGMTLNPLRQTWAQTNDVAVNYVMVAV